MLEFLLVVPRECYMRGPSWKGTGFRLWQELANFERGYFLPRCDDAGQEVVRKPAGYAEAALSGQ